MSFLAPTLLLGLLGLAIPLAAHFWHRQKPIVLHFSTLRFFATYEPTHQRRKQFSDLMLLLIRILLFATLVVFLARPACQGRSELQVVNRPQDAVILIDSSASMQWLVDGQSQYERTLDQIEEILDTLPVGSRVALTTSNPHGPRLELDQDDTKIRRLLEQSREHPTGSPLFGDHARSLGQSLDEAIRILHSSADSSISSDATQLTQVIYALGDRSSGGISSLPPANDDSPTIIAVPSLEEESKVIQNTSNNFGLIDVRSEIAKDLGNRTIRIRGQIQSPQRGPKQGQKREQKRTSDANQELEASHAEAQRITIGLFVEENEISRTTVQVSQNTDEAFEFVHTLDEGDDAKRAVIRILSPKTDAYFPDNQHFLWLSAPAKLKIVLVNGDPSEHRSHDELFFLATMLQTSALQSQIDLRTLAPSQLAELVDDKGYTAFEGIDLLVLANVEAPDPTLTSHVEQKVREGMGLWITAGDRVSASKYNERFANILPLLLREAVFLGTAPGRSKAQNEAIAPVNLSHPIFQGERNDLDLVGTRTRRLFLLEPDPKRNSSIAVAIGNGAPLLITQNLDEGRIAFLSTTIDRDWSDLALRPGFVTMVERTVHWLTRIDSQQQNQPLLVGDPVTLQAPAPLKVYQPNGENVLFDPKQGSHSFLHTWQAGWYRADLPTNVSTESNPSIARFSVNVDPKESEGPTQWSMHATASSDIADSPLTWVPNWQPLAFAALILMAVESITRWKARSKVLGKHQRNHN